MTGILLHARPEDAAAAEIVRAALERSFTPAQVLDDAGRADVLVALRPDGRDAALVDRFRRRGRKLVFLGGLDEAMADRAGLAVDAVRVLEPEEARVPGPRGESPAAVVWHDGARRPLARLDHEDGWNLLGDGPIPADDDHWSAAQHARAAGATPLATLAVGDDERGLYASRLDADDHALLWINRAVGPVDGPEWSVVERFVSDHRPDDLTCLPSLVEVPRGRSAAVTMRLDCDEAVASARPLFEAYVARSVPFSLSIVTGREHDAGDRALMREVLAAGGSLVSHSVHHRENWGADRAEALEEARGSRRWLGEAFPEMGPARYAVSPFHHSSRQAVQALAEAGYEAFVGGLSGGDRAYTLGRAGRVPGADIVSHSQQAMLHGDLFHRDDGPGAPTPGGGLAPYVAAFDRHTAAGSAFGWLDHPFSPRYAYGWTDEAERIAAHMALLDHVAGDDVWHASLGDLLGHLVHCARTRLAVEGGRLVVDAPSPRVDVRWKGARGA